MRASMQESVCACVYLQCVPAGSIYSVYLEKACAPVCIYSLTCRFDLALANEEERMAFAHAQRGKMAKLLGLAPEDIDILHVDSVPSAT